MDSTCPLCERSGPLQMESHHLWTRRKDKHDTETLCRECHKTIHGLFPHKALRDKGSGLNSLEGLRENPEIQKALGFIRKVPPGAHMKMKESVGRRGRR